MPKWGDYVSWKQLAVIMGFILAANGAATTVNLLIVSQAKTALTDQQHVFENAINKLVGDLCDKFDLKYASKDAMQTQKESIIGIERDIGYIAETVKKVERVMNRLANDPHGGP